MLSPNQETNMPNDVDLASIVMTLASRVTSLEAEMESLSASVTLVREAAFAAEQSIEASMSLLQESVAGLHDDMGVFGEAITQLQAKSHDLDTVAPGLRSWISELQQWMATPPEDRLPLTAEAFDAMLDGSERYRGTERGLLSLSADIQNLTMQVASRR